MSSRCVLAKESVNHSKSAYPVNQIARGAAVKAAKVALVDGSR
jgi:hypothetical protein